MTTKNNKKATMQLQMDFEPGLLQQYPDFLDLMMVVVYSSRPGLTGCAAACDVAPSTLARMLRKDPDAEQKRNLPAEFIPVLIEATGDRRPLEWLAEKFFPDPEQVKRAAMNRIAELLPTLNALVGTVQR